MSTHSARLSAAGRADPLRFDRRELAGAFGDLGVLVPIAVALIVGNGLSATAVLLPAGLLYVVGGLVYRLPVPVQPLKAFGAIAIAEGLGSDEIAAGALLMGAIFLTLGATGVLDRAARWFPRVVIRGVQLSVGLLFCTIAFGMVTSPSPVFADHDRAGWVLVVAAPATAAVALLWRRRAVTLVLVAAAVVAIVVQRPDGVALGPSAVQWPQLDGSVFATALVVLVLPQLPLTFANSCLATADAARTYFGDRAAAVRPDRLAMTLGTANLAAGAVSGMPVCHGAGGLSAHRAFGARTGGAVVVMGTVLIALALSLGAGLAGLLTAFPLPILAGMLAVAGVLHIVLLRDLQGWWEWALALAVGLLGVLGNLAVALVLGLALWWGPRALRTLRR